MAIGILGCSSDTPVQISEEKQRFNEIYETVYSTNEPITELPTSTPRPPPTKIQPTYTPLSINVPTYTPLPQEVDEDTALYWSYVGLAAELGTGVRPVDPRNKISFQEAQVVLLYNLFDYFDDHLIEIENYGIDPFKQMNICFNATVGMWNLEKLKQQTTTKDSLPYIEGIFEAISGLERTIWRLNDTGISEELLRKNYNPQECDAIAKEWGDNL